MTQINKGKNRELNPLYNRKNAAISSLINSKQQYYGEKQEYLQYNIFHFAIITQNKGILPCLLENLGLL